MEGPKFWSLNIYGVWHKPKVLDPQASYELSLKEENFIRDYILVKDNKQDILRVFLNYDYNDKPVIHGIQRQSKPGCRSYVTADNLPRVLNGMGIAILTTSKGDITDKKAKLLNVGGEVICQVW